MHNSIPYIKHLLSKGVNILVLQEHWLWAFELDQLRSIESDFAYTAVCLIIVSRHPQHSLVVAEAVPSSGESRYYLLSQSPTLTPTGSAVFSFLSKAPSYTHHFWCLHADLRASSRNLQQLYQYCKSSYLHSTSSITPFADWRSKLPH